jgi:hypothetical protein
MDELNDKIEGVLASVTAQVNALTPPPASKGRRRILFKNKDGLQKQKDLAGDEFLGIWTDPRLIGDQLKAQGEDVATVEFPKTLPYKDVLKWRETLSNAFMKAWMSRVDLLAFSEAVCYCGERLMDKGLYEIVLSDIYDRFSDRCLELSSELKKSPNERSNVEYSNSRLASAYMRFYLGRCMALYQTIIRGDETAKRPDTVDALQDVLKDVCNACDLANLQEWTVREEVYWAVYNACLIALRVSRWLRLRGFGGVSTPALWWLTDSMSKCLPLMAVQQLHFRMRFYEELIYCHESVRQLGESARICQVAIEQVEKARELEAALPPVPEETTQTFKTLLSRFKLLKIKYSFWQGEAVPDPSNPKAAAAPLDAKVAFAQAAEAPPPDPKAAAPPLDPKAVAEGIACLVEVLQFNHGISRTFGRLISDDATGNFDTPDESGHKVVRWTHAEVHAKQCDIIEVLANQVEPFFLKIDQATEFLDDFTEKRLKFEELDDRIARGEDVSLVDEKGDDIVAPTPPDADGLTGMGFDPQSGIHSIEEVLPLAAHVILMRESLRHEMLSGGTKVAGIFKKLEKYLAKRVRYRHFLCPPLVDVDVTQTKARTRDKVDLPDKYEVLTDDLNALALRNRKGGDAEENENSRSAGPGELHLFVIGQRYNPWENWTLDHTVKIDRLCNFRIIFSKKPPVAEKLISNPDSLGYFGQVPGDSCKYPKPWLDPYSNGNANDFTSFDHVQETSQATDVVMQNLLASGYISVPKCIPLPIEAHTGAALAAGGKQQDGSNVAVPYLVFQKFEERKLWAADAHLTEPSAKTKTLLPSDVSQTVEGGEVGSETLLPPWSPILEDALAAAVPVTDIMIFTSKHMHAFVPHRKYNTMMRADLRQTPHELHGRAFQTYIYTCMATNAPSLVSVIRQLRACRALHALHVAGQEAAAADSDEGRSQRPPLMNRLLEVAQCVERSISGAGGQLFLLDSADFIEDMCAYAFLKFLWPRLRTIQEALLREEQGERMLNHSDRMDLSEWSDLLRKVLPVLLQVLGEVQSVDAITLGSAAFALAKLFMKVNDGKSAQSELGKAINRLEGEIAEPWTQGVQPKYNQPVASVVSFDPPSLRSSDFAFFVDSIAGEEKMASETGKEETALVLRRMERLEQERLCLLFLLYERWIDCSLKTHLKDVSSTVKRVLRPSEIPDQEDHLGAGGDTGLKVALSNPEAAVLARLGENPYLRCLFFVAVARRRPDVATAALGKACTEAETAISQERGLWNFCEKELVRQQEILQGEHTYFAKEFLRIKKKQKQCADPPLPALRSPYSIVLRVPPLPNSAEPPRLSSSVDFSPPSTVAAATEAEGGDSKTNAVVCAWNRTLAWQEIHEEWHPRLLGVRSASSTPVTCAVFGKAFGTGTTVSELHSDLRGTGVRHAGFDYVEITDLKPNTNYSFASMYFEGFEAVRPSISAVSESSPPIGTYYPLPISLLRVHVCKAAFEAGGPGQQASAWKRSWAPLLELFCEATREEERHEACGLRMLKLRRDVADRQPPAVLSAFSELVLMKNRSAGKKQQYQRAAFPTTRPAQQSVLRSANECLVAADCARQAGNSHLTFQCVSLTLKLVSSLLRYRTKPRLLFALLVKCAVLLDAYDVEKHPLAWHTRTRSTVAYLLHQVSMLCVQLRQFEALSSIHVDGDSPKRYDAHVLADGQLQVATKNNVLDHALELALLGSVTWQHAEQKAAVPLKGEADGANMTRLLKDLSERAYEKVMTDAMQFVLQQQQQDQESGEKPPLTLTMLSLLRCAASRQWAAVATGRADGMTLVQALNEVLSQHRLSAWLDRALEQERSRFLDYGYMLRALPLARMQRTQQEADEDDDPLAPSATQPMSGAVVDAEATEAFDATMVATTDPVNVLRKDQGSMSLAHLELLRAARLLKDMQGLKLFWHDIPRFKMFDLEQLADKLPDISKRENDETDDMYTGDDDKENEASKENDAEDGEAKDWVLKKRKDRDNRRQAFEYMKKALRPLARAAMYASATGSDQLLFTTLIAGLNALLLAGPLPEDCIPQGPKANPLDTEPDRYVGAEPDFSEEGNAGGAAPTGKVTEGKVFEPGNYGMQVKWATGLITYVAPGGQAEKLGVREDWHLHTIDGAPFTKEKMDALLDPKSKASCTVTFIEDENDVWLNLAVIAQCAVQQLLRLKEMHSSGEVVKGAANEGAARTAQQPQPKMDGGLDPEVDRELEEEERVWRDAKESAEAMQALDEELHDIWFDEVPELDIKSTAKFVAFTVLCLFNMRRWNSVLNLCRNFNDATCSVFGGTFLKLAIGAQAEMCKLSKNALENTERYMTEAKAELIEQKNNLPRKLLRQLALQGALSEPEKFYNERMEKYENVHARQQRLNGAWTVLLDSLQSAFDLSDRVVPLAVKQLSNSRILLASFLVDKQDFLLNAARGEISGGLRVKRERALKIAAMALISSYRKSVELLKKRQVTDKLVQALHELGNLLYLEGDVAGAQQAWSDAVDVAFQYVYAIKNWRSCMEEAVTPPQDTARTEMMLLIIVVLAKHARLTTPRDMAAQVNASLFGSTIVEAVLKAGLPHPYQRIDFSLDRYQMREIFYGLREASILLPPSSVHGGVDGLTFFGSLAFFHKTLLATEYQQERCLPLCSMFNYVATDVCRNSAVAMDARLFMASALIRCRSLTAAWLALHAASKLHGMPRALGTSQCLDSIVADAQDLADVTPFSVSEEPFSEQNKLVVNKLIDFQPFAEGSELASKSGDFIFLQAEFLVTVCSYGRVYSKCDEPEELCRTQWLDKAEAKLNELWTKLTGNDDKGGGSAVDESLVTLPTTSLTPLAIEQCVQIRLLLSRIWELRGDLGQAVRQVFYGMRFFELVGGPSNEEPDENNVQKLAAGSANDYELWTHAETVTWMLLRRRMVNLLVCQGRLEAAKAHINQGVNECRDVQDDVSLVELLAAKVRVEILSGHILEVHGQQRTGAVPTAERCIEVAKRLLVPTASAVYARMNLALIFEENPSLRDVDATAPPQASNMDDDGDQDPYEHMLLEAKGQVIISPLARQELAYTKAPNSRCGVQDVARWVMHNLETSVEELASLLGACYGPGIQNQDLQLHPNDMNYLFRNSASAPKGSDPAVNLELDLLPPSGNRFCEKSLSDCRQNPNLYMQLAPSRLHCELILARLLLDHGFELGDSKYLDRAETVLQEAELRMAYCVHLLPWLYVEFCRLKLRWRRMCHETKQNKESAPLDASNHKRYSDPAAFADGICPPTDSPLFRTFMKCAYMPSLTQDSGWVPRPLTGEDDGLDKFLGELYAVLQIAVQQGGHDYAQLLALCLEGLEEVLRVARLKGETGSDLASSAEKVHAVFACLVGIADCRKALFFVSAAGGPVAEDPKAKDAKGKGVADGPVPIDCKLMPPRVRMDIQRHLKRQAWEGALAYSSAAQLDSSAFIPFRAAVRHARALRRECDLFSSIFHSERLACDQLHATLAQSSPAYAKAKVLNESLLEGIKKPASVPTSSEILIAWSQPSAHATGKPASTFCGYSVFICPEATEGGAQSLVARSRRVSRDSIKQLYDTLSTDLEHCLPADFVSAAFLAGRLRAATNAFRGSMTASGSEEELLDDEIEVGLRQLLDSLKGDVSGPLPGDDTAAEPLDAGKVRELLGALLQLLDRTSDAARVSHSGLSSFLRIIVKPLAI